MMDQFSTTALFCEDIREEQNGIVSLIGVLPDNINVQGPASHQSVPPATTKTLPKLCLFVRLNLDLDSKVPDVKVQIVMPDGRVMPAGGADQEVIKKSRGQAKESGLPFAGIVIRAVMVPFQIPKPGMLKVEMIAGAETKLIGGLNFRIVRAPQPVIGSDI